MTWWDQRSMLVGVAAATALLAALSGCGSEGRGNVEAIETSSPRPSVSPATPSGSPTASAGSSASAGSTPAGTSGGTGNDPGGSQGEAVDIAERYPDAPLLVDMHTEVGHSLSHLVLHFRPSTGLPDRVTVQKSPDATLPELGTGRPIHLDGVQGLEVSLAHSWAATNLPVLEPGGPMFAEVRAQPGFEAVTVVSVGLAYDQDVVVTVHRESNVIAIGVRPESPGDDASSPGRKHCGSIAFAPRSEHGAGRIRATGVDCSVAREVTAASEGQIGEDYTHSGFSCVVTDVSTGSVSRMRVVEYACERGDARITFKAV